jgi:hypothetical protein
VAKQPERRPHTRLEGRSTTGCQLLEHVYPKEGQGPRESLFKDTGTYTVGERHSPEGTCDNCSLKLEDQSFRGASVYSLNPEEIHSSPQ